MHKLIAGLAGVVVLLSCGTTQTAHVAIDWIDFVKWDGITYVAVTTPGAQLSTSALDSQIGTVKKKVADVVTDPSYQSQDGDAAFLPIGTAIYSMTDYRMSFRIAVEIPSVKIYEADTNTRATLGSDLVDLEGKVAYIGAAPMSAVASAVAIRDSATVDALVTMILNGRVDQSWQPPDSAPVSITLHFKDGTQSTRAFWPSPGVLQRGIRVPQEFVRIIDDALR